MPTKSGAVQRVETPDDWPCVQVFVPSLSPSTIWPGPPVDEYLKAWPDHRELAPIASRAVSRSVNEAEAVAEVDRFAAEVTGDRNETLTLLFAGIFTEADQARDRAITGILQFAHAQQRLLAGLSGTVAELDAARAATPPDPARIRQLSDQIAWQRRIIDERQRSLTALCEQPAIVEGRLGRLARTIASHMD